MNTRPPIEQPLASLRPCRRACPRLAATRAAKVYRHATRGFAPAQTIDYSASGALIELAAHRPATIGETVDLAIEFKTTGVLRPGSFQRATVVRVEPVEGTGGHDQPARVRVAVRFDRPLMQVAA